MSGTVLTSDYWTINLPSQLATSAARSPSVFAYQAALIKLDATALYSPVKIAALVDPAVKSTKVPFEQHHLFPRGYLEDNGITDLKRINQIANLRRSSGRTISRSARSLRPNMCRRSITN